MTVKRAASERTAASATGAASSTTAMAAEAQLFGEQGRPSPRRPRPAGAMRRPSAELSPNERHRAHARRSRGRVLLRVPLPGVAQAGPRRVLAAPGACGGAARRVGAAAPVCRAAAGGKTLPPPRTHAHRRPACGAGPGREELAITGRSREEHAAPPPPAPRSTPRQTPAPRPPPASPPSSPQSGRRPLTRGLRGS